MDSICAWKWKNIEFVKIEKIKAVIYRDRQFECIWNRIDENGTCLLNMFIILDVAFYKDWNKLFSECMIAKFQLHLILKKFQF